MSEREQEVLDLLQDFDFVLCNCVWLRDRPKPEAVCYEHLLALLKKLGE